MIQEIVDSTFRARTPERVAPAYRINSASHDYSEFRRASFGRSWQHLTLPAPPNPRGVGRRCRVVSESLQSCIRRRSARFADEPTNADFLGSVCRDAPGAIEPPSETVGAGSAEAEGSRVGCKRGSVGQLGGRDA